MKQMKHRRQVTYGCIHDEGTQCLMKYEWKEGEWKNNKTIIDSKQKFIQKVEIKETNTDLS